LNGTSSRSHVHTLKAEISIRTDTVTDIAVQCVQAGVPDQRCATVVQLYITIQKVTISGKSSLPPVYVGTHFAALSDQVLQSLVHTPLRPLTVLSVQATSNSSASTHNKINVN
jgi:hypothetical protein